MMESLQILINKRKNYAFQKGLTQQGNFLQIPGIWKCGERNGQGVKQQGFGDPACLETLATKTKLWTSSTYLHLQDRQVCLGL